MLRKGLILFCAIVLVLGGIYFYGWNEATKMPDNSPGRFLKQPATGGKVVVCIGDSITHGRVSFNYVDLLARRPGMKGYRIVNAGINSEYAYNVMLRLDEIRRCNPDYITVLIGTNDANGSVSESNSKKAIKEMKLPRTPSAEWFRENLDKICMYLKKNTRAKIALFSLPPIGEEPQSLPFMRAAEYSRIIKEVAGKHSIAYLPLNEKMTAFLSTRKNEPVVRYNENWQGPMYMAIAKHVLLGKSWDDIARANGFLLLTDLLHLNGTGAAMAAGMAQGFILAR